MPSYVIALPIKNEAAGNELVAALHDEKSKHFSDLVPRLSPDQDLADAEAD